jgi:hypothetical protein
VTDRSNEGDEVSRSMLATVRPTSSLTRTPQWANVSMTATSRAGEADRTFDGGGLYGELRSRQRRQT